MRLVDFVNTLSMERNDNNIGKIIKLPYAGGVSDDDITALFVGLVKLIKQNSMKKCENYYAEYIDKLKKEVALLRLENRILQGDVK